MTELRSYQEIARILDQIRKEVHRYLPDFVVGTFNYRLYPQFREDLAFTAKDREGHPGIFFSEEFLEQAPIDEIWATARHEIGHPLNSDTSLIRARAHGPDFVSTVRALGGSPSMYGGYRPSRRQEKYVWRCADCGMEEHSETKKLPAAFINQCPRRPEGESHRNFYMRDLITRQRWKTHPLTRRWA
jgi:hypothetical protein